MVGFTSFEAAQDTPVGIELMHKSKKRQMVVEAGEERLTVAALFSSLAAESPHRLGPLPLHSPVSTMCDGAEEFSRQATVLSLSSAPCGDIVDLDEDACPLPVGMSNAEEAICDQLPAGRTLGGTIGRERGSHRPCSWRRRLHPPALRADAARQPPAAPVGQRVN